MASNKYLALKITKYYSIFKTSNSFLHVSQLPHVLKPLIQINFLSDKGQMKTKEINENQRIR